jgi:hypothetical protein
MLRCETHRPMLQPKRVQALVRLASGAPEWSHYGQTEVTLGTYLVNRGHRHGEVARCRLSSQAKSQVGTAALILEVSVDVALDAPVP